MEERDPSAWSRTRSAQTTAEHATVTPQRGKKERRKKARPGVEPGPSDLHAAVTPPGQNRKKGKKVPPPRVELGSWPPEGRVRASTPWRSKRKREREVAHPCEELNLGFPMESRASLPLDDMGRTEEKRKEECILVQRCLCVLIVT